MLAVKAWLRRLVSRRRLSIESALWVWLILALAAGLRLLRIGANSLWSDEAFSWMVARQPAWAILTQRLEPILPPFYHFALHFWVRLVGESEVALRSYSALCGLLAIPVVYATGRRLFGPSTAVMAALLMAVLPFQVYFAQETRLYALVILLSALLLWGFSWAWQGGDWWRWAGLGVLIALNLYAHYFAAFVLVVLHLFLLLVRFQDKRSWTRLILADGIALALWGPHFPSAWRQMQQVTESFWLPVPSLLELFKTLDYLLFGHTTPAPLVPAALFFTLSVLALVTLGAFRARGEGRRWVLLLLALMLTPLLAALILSWLLDPVYLDRSFSLVTPAYMLLLGWGLTHPPGDVWGRRLLRLLYAGLIGVAVISLGHYYLTPDPAKPPFREVGAAVEEQWREGDVLFHLHDSSYLPLLYYAPVAAEDSCLLNIDPEAWLPPYTWAWAGRRVSSLEEAVAGRERLWIVVAESEISGGLGERYENLLERLDASYSCGQARTWVAVTLRCCDLSPADGP